MKKIAFVWLAMVMLIALPCLAFDGFQGHEGQIPLCQNNKTGALKFAPSKDIDKTPGLNYEPRCNEKTETLIWVTLGPPSGLQALIEPMVNVSEDAFIAQGWTECYSDLYTDSGTPLSTIFSQCNKKYLMLACRPVGSNTFTVASYANRNDVLTDTGDGDNYVTHTANGAGWYYNSQHSWGFAQAGDPVRKNSCDIPEAFDPNSPNLEMRLCWHTGGGNLTGGFRCGTELFLQGVPNWERVILHRN
jgi:hypothetical protein